MGQECWSFLSAKFQLPGFPCRGSLRNTMARGDRKGVQRLAPELGSGCISLPKRSLGLMHSIFHYELSEGKPYVPEFGTWTL